MNNYTGIIWIQNKAATDYSELDPYQAVSRLFDSLSAAKAWVEAESKKQPHAIGSGEVEMCPDSFNVYTWLFDSGKWSEVTYA